jgi:23S rRNA (pseudouridine1915-N3)-methyltransferase
MPIRIICIGKKHESWVSQGIERYQRRLKRPFDIEWVILPHSAQSDATARQEESQRILSRLSVDDFVILLDEKGKAVNSSELSNILLSKLQSSQKIIIVIGGAYGVDETMHKRANFVWSLSPLVFPHQLVRLILSEQLYRAQEIAGNKPYHHE